ncbi:Thiol-disulfide oxidoreductase ResA [Rubripirellula obstinata]|uniref:Thiol-disulfide oxidoreductase ResA n=1 Tax=Rubripirellula obstinata TaxID=406547 RepID=A0A5B1CKC6_9BACT|nr:TlpA family protein disulfide reductase [Rubripirellula obstinata]KAA1261016.1 Thiol-disulfide oxidoreductase ResA [Rubripirellula obstinata]
MTRTTEQVSNRLFSTTFLAVVVFCLCFFFAMRFASVDSVLVNPAVGKPAPQIDLIKLPGSDELSAAEIKLDGRITLLHFWGTWCGPCRMEYPELAQATESLGDQNKFQFVPVSCEGSSRETFEGLWEKTSSFFGSEGINSVAFADPRGITRQSMGQRLEQPSLYYPTSVLIGSDGKIAGVWEGYSENGIAEIVAMVKSLANTN